MRLLPFLKIPVLLLSITTLVCAQAVTSANTTLPTVISYALDKSKVTLPADLSSTHNVLVFYFEPDQGDAAFAWVKGLEQLRTAHPDLQSYILPVYAKENFFYRWWIEASTRIGAPPSQDRHRTIPIFVDKQKFFAPLGVSSEKQPFIVLTDQAGHVEWKTQGSFEQWRADQLASELGSDAPHIAGNIVSGR